MTRHPRAARVGVGLAGGAGLGLAMDIVPDDVGLFAVPYAHIAGPDWLVMLSAWGITTVLMEQFVPAAAVGAVLVYLVLYASIAKPGELEQQDQIR